MSTPCGNLLRVEKGYAEREELAAIAVVLMARAAGPPSAAPPHRGCSKAGWCRPEYTPGLRAPHSWQG